MPKFDSKAEFALIKGWATGHVVAAVAIGLVVGLVLGMILG